jgi:NADH-quinone oxidoreductase subunit G
LSDISLTVDGQVISAAPGELVIAAAERHGVYIPRFCYHPRMTSVGMCRMCLVEVEGPRGSALQVSCMLDAAEGMVVHTASPLVKKAQDGVLEFLLINHPLDCPVCDKGGECPLQDQTMAYGPGESRFVEEKRHFEKPIPISDLVFLDRERCILCDRCTRFASEVAGDPLISFTGRGNETQVLTFPDEPFASYFSGNTVQICPVGALTAKPYRFKARPWDLEQEESTCTTCAVGCRVTVQSSRDRVLRYQGVDIDPVNWGWLCDKGRFGFEAIEHEERLASPLLRDGDTLVEASWPAALDRAATAIREAIIAGGADSVAVIGGARLTNEDAYAWAKLAKAVIGTDNVDAQLGDGLDPHLVAGLPTATIDEACAADTLLVLAPDLKEELPVLYLRVRDGVQKRGLRVVELSPTATSLTPLAAASLRYRPGEQAALVASLLSGGTPPEGVGADWFAPSANVVVLAGRPSVAETGAPTEAAIAAAVAARPTARFLVTLRRGNVRGAIDMGLAPGLLPGRVALDAGRAWFASHWGSVPAKPGLDTTAILGAAADGRIRCLVLLGADPLSDFPDRRLAERALSGVESLIGVDTFLTPSLAQATVVLAAAGFAEKRGTSTNLEGRVSLLSQKVTPPGTARADWMIAAELAVLLEGDLGLESVEAIWAEIEEVSSAHAGVSLDLLRSTAGHDGVIAGAGEHGVGQQGSRPAMASFTAPQSAPEPPPLDAYSLRLVSSRSLYDLGVALHHSPALSGLASDVVLRMNPTDHERLGVAQGAQVKVTSSRTTVLIAAVADPAVARGVASLGFNRPGIRAADLIDATAVVTDVRVETP